MDKPGKYKIPDKSNFKELRDSLMDEWADGKHMVSMARDRPRNSTLSNCIDKTSGVDQFLFFGIEMMHLPPLLSFCYLTTLQPQAWIIEVRLYAFLAYAFPSRLKIACLGLGNNSIEQEEKQ